MAEVLAPGATIGILGGGQLGRLLSLSAAKMGFQTHLFCPDNSAPAFKVTPLHSCANYEDEGALKAFAEQVDVITYEFENVPLMAVDILSAIRPVLPGRKALEVTQDRLLEKDFLVSLGLRVAPYHAVKDSDDLKAYLSDQSDNYILKTRRFGYDGKGQITLAQGHYSAEALHLADQAPCILEQKINFQAEISIVLVRCGRTHTMACYALSENHHEQGILKTTLAPSKWQDMLYDEACQQAQDGKALEHFAFK
jgi:5-(carboxyamino)imidazole ribonucleotide synthase